MAFYKTRFFLLSIFLLAGHFKCSNEFQVVSQCVLHLEIKIDYTTVLNELPDISSLRHIFYGDTDQVVLQTVASSPKRNISKNYLFKDKCGIYVIYNVSTLPSLSHFLTTSLTVPSLVLLAVKEIPLVPSSFREKFGPTLHLMDKMRFVIFKEDEMVFYDICFQCSNQIQETIWSSNTPVLGQDKRQFSKDVRLTIEYWMNLDSQPHCLDAAWKSLPSSFVKSDCSKEAIAAETVSKHLNISVIYRIPQEERDLHGFHISSFSDHIYTYPGPIYFKGGLGRRLVYCEEVDEISMLLNDNWVGPYEMEAWVVLLLLIGGMSILLCCLHNAHRKGPLSATSFLLFFSCVMFKQQLPKGGRKLPIPISVGLLALLLLQGLYEHYLTSDLIIPSKPKFFQTLREIVDNGYTIVDMLYGADDAFPNVTYFGDFERSDIAEKVNDATLAIFGVGFEESHIRKYLGQEGGAQGKKYALIESYIQEMYSEMLLETVNVVVNASKCFRVPEVIGHTFFFDRFVAHFGSLWVRTLERLRESGHLYFIWYTLEGVLRTTEWKTLAKRLHYDFDGEQAYISLSQLSSLFLVTGLGWGGGVLGVFLWRIVGVEKGLSLDREDGQGHSHDGHES